MNAIYTILQQNHIPVMSKKAFLHRNKKSNFLEEGVFFKRDTDLKVFFEESCEKTNFDKNWENYLEKNKDAVVKTKSGKLVSFLDNDKKTKNLQSWIDLEPTVFSYYNINIPEKQNINKIIFIILSVVFLILLIYYLKKISLL